MGSVIALDEYVNRLGKVYSHQSRAYNSLIQAERELFGTASPSFLEKIICEPDRKGKLSIATTETAVNNSIDVNFLNSDFSFFEKYDLTQYENFIGQSISYYRRFKPENWQAIDKLLHVARHLFRHEQYLPKITQVREIASQNSGIFKKLSYYLRERRAEKKLKNFRDELLFKPDSLLLRL